MTKITSHFSPMRNYASIEKQPKKEDKPLPIGLNWLIGTFAGILEVAVNQPLVSIKNELQKETIKLSPSILYGRLKSKNSRVILIKELKTTFSPFVLYAGFGSNAGGMAFITGTQVTVNASMKNVFSKNGQNPLSDAQKVLCALFAGSAGAFFAAPSEQFMDRYREAMKRFKALEAQSSPLAIRPTYKEIVQTAIKVEGFQVLLLGVVPTIARDGGFAAGYLVGAPEVNRQLKMHIIYLQNHPKLSYAVSGVIAGLFTAFITHPADTWKTKVQSRINSRFWQGSVRKTYQEAYKGFIPRALRIALAVPLLYAVTDKCSSFAKKYI